MSFVPHAPTALCFSAGVKTNNLTFVVGSAALAGSCCELVNATDLFVCVPSQGAGLMGRRPVEVLVILLLSWCAASLCLRTHRLCKRFFVPTLTVQPRLSLRVLCVFPSAAAMGARDNSTEAIVIVTVDVGGAQSSRNRAQGALVARRCHICCAQRTRCKGAVACASHVSALMLAVRACVRLWMGPGRWARCRGSCGSCQDCEGRHAVRLWPPLCMLSWASLCVAN